MWSRVQVTVAILTPMLLSVSIPARGESNFLNVTGDVIIGAMFPIHNLIEGAKCGTLINDQAGIQHLEALLFALKKVNEELDEVGITMGVMAYDTCYSDTVALEAALQFVKLHTTTLGLDSFLVCPDKSTPVPINSGKLIGVVGAATSSVSIQLASFLRLFKMPQISYSATSPELSNRKRYDFFMRTVASDVYQADAIVKILRTFQWQYVVGIYDDTSYGVMGFEQVRIQAREQGICIAQEFEIKRYFSSQNEKRRQLEYVVKELTKFNNTYDKITVILFSSFDVADDLFGVASKFGLKGRIRWVGVDGWTGYAIAPDLAGLVDGTLGVQPKIKDVPEFDKYFMDLTPETNGRNPWFGEYWEQLFNCSLGGTTDLTSGGKMIKRAVCKDTNKLSLNDGTYDRHLNTYSVMDAVYAFGKAVKLWHQKLCPGKQSYCDALRLANVEDVMGYLQDVTFTDPAGFNFHFTNNSGPPRYSIMQYGHDERTGFGWREVADVNTNDNQTNEINWFENLSTSGHYHPSICSPSCGPGAAKQSIPHRKCCWTCWECTPFQFLQESNQTCQECPLGQRSNGTRNGCETIPETTMDMNNIGAIISIVFSCIGVIVTCLIAGLFYWQKETPIIMASGKELSFVLLAGILLSYASTFSFVAHPTPSSCGSTRLMLGLSYTIIYAAILVKTNRIYRVFNIHTSKPKKVRFICAKSQLLITFGIVVVEIIALTSWLIFDVPRVMHQHPSRAENVRVCEDSMDFAYLGALVYPLLLMILCVYYAIKTRKTPDGFNETRYITFGSYSFCVLWIAFTSIYFSVENNTIRIVALCFASTFNATVTLITLFITKAYVVLLRPQKNTRENVMSRRRTHSYDTVDIHNLNNLSRMASAVSTWHSAVHTGVGSELSQTQSVINGGHQPIDKRFGHSLSVSALSVNRLGNSSDSLYSDKTVQSAPGPQTIEERPQSEQVEIIGTAGKMSIPEALRVGQEVTPRRTSQDLGDERLKQFLESDHHVSGYRSDDDGRGTSIASGHARRSLKSFRSRKKRMRSVKRTRSMDPNIPHIIVTASSTEDNSKIIDKSRAHQPGMVKVIHL